MNLVAAQRRVCVFNSRLYSHFFSSHKRREYHEQSEQHEKVVVIPKLVGNNGNGSQRLWAQCTTCHGCSSCDRARCRSGNSGSERPNRRTNPNRECLWHL